MADENIDAHPAFARDQAAVITGAASGIGFAAARRYARGGMRVCLADLPGDKLEAAFADVAAIASTHGGAAMAVGVDVGKIGDLQKLKAKVFEKFGAVAVLMNNAGISRKTTAWTEIENWRKLLEVNLWGVINSVQTFLPDMIAQQSPALVINTGSKQGITNPPGNPGYNVTKAGVKALTEQLAHELRALPNCGVSAHLLVPGFTFTGITGVAQKPAAAWTPDQVIDFMLDSIARGDFYILCPDNDVTRGMDERRMQWSADDLIRNRPALSRWHPDFKAAFDTFMSDDKPKQ
jgi:NAD(P)-dependent dehydrogenase (short-subunit alcohol dehydrogenase family)